MSIPYDTALRLKQAGFPQKKNLTAKGRGKYMAYEPTLSELIAECSPSNNSCILLNITKDATIAQKGRFIEIGETPELAVANLYLALHPIS